MKCKRCDAEVKDDKDETLARAGWGWTMAPDPGLGEDAQGVIPGWWYACPDCSDDDSKNAFAFALTEQYRNRHRRRRPSPHAQRKER